MRLGLAKKLAELSLGLPTTGRWDTLIAFSLTVTIYDTMAINNTARSEAEPRSMYNYANTADSLLPLMIMRTETESISNIRS